MKNQTVGLSTIVDDETGVQVMVRKFDRSKMKVEEVGLLVPGTVGSRK